MALVTDQNLIDNIATQHNLKDVKWVDLNVFGTLVGFANGTSRYVEESQPTPQRF